MAAAAVAAGTPSRSRATRLSQTKSRPASRPGRAIMPPATRPIVFTGR